MTITWNGDEMPDIKVVKIAEGKYNLSTMCLICGKTEGVIVNSQDYFNWNHGMHIQNAFPYLTANQREILISGFCGQCFDETFAGIEDK